MDGHTTSGDIKEVLQPNVGEYEVLTHLNLYDSPECTRLATQARAERHLFVLSNVDNADAHQTVEVRLCEDDYPGWLKVENLKQLRIATRPYRAQKMSRAEI